MILIGNTVISNDLLENFFVCDLEKCKGACCVEGDLGAPLEEHEKQIMLDILEAVKPYLSEAGLREIERQGAFILDEEGDYSTPTIKHKECAFAVYDKRGILKCGIEQAYLDGKIDFKKPISCHLYPVRITNYDEFDAINYDRWQICNPACDHGRKLGVPLYKFLKEPLVRKYGADWYAELEAEIASRGEE